MIRFAFRLITLMIAVVLLAGLGRLAHSTWIEVGSMRSEQGIRLDQTDLSLVYEVPRFKWLEFPAPGARRIARVIAHADVQSASEPSPQQIYQFLILARFVDADGETLDERNMRFRTRLVEYQDADTGQRYKRAFYTEGGTQPTSTQETRLAIPGPDVHSIQFQLLEADPTVQAVQMRLYKQEPPAENRLEKAWDRLSLRTRNMLAAGNLYPIEFLTAREKVNLVRNRWKPAGPRGIEDEDYRVREMRVFRHRSGEPVATMQSGNGSFVARWLNLPIQIPEPGRLRLEFEAAESATSESPPSKLQIAGTLYPVGGEEPLVRLPEFEKDAAFLEVSPGLLDLQFSQPGHVRAYLQVESKLERELEIDRVALRNYFLHPETPLTFPIRHAGPEGTSLRLDLACQCDPSDGLDQAQASTASFRVMDERGTVLQAGEINNPAGISRYAYVRLSTPTALTEHSRYMIHLPQSARTLELLGASELLVNVFSRPRDLPRRVLVAHEADEAQAEDLRRLWFPLRPSSYEKLRNSLRSSMVMRGRRPPEPDLARHLGDYQWERFEPQGDWVGRYLLEPRQADAGMRSGSLGSTYRKVHPNREVELEVQSSGIASSVPMRVIVRRAAGRAAPVRIWVDGRIRWRGRVTGQTAELDIGRIKVGMRKLRIETPGVDEVLINYTGPGEAGFSKRLAIRVRDPKLEIPFEKRSAEQETLSGILYLPARSSENLRVRTEIVGQHGLPLRMFASATVSSSELEFTRIGGPPVQVLNATRASSLVARRFFLPLGEDLPAGAYRLRLEFDDVSDTYLILSRSLPGSAATRYLRHESLGPEGEV